MMTRKFCSQRRAARPGRHQQIGAIGRTRKSLAAGASDAERLPLAQRHLPRTVGEEEIEIRRQDDFVAPPLAAGPSVRLQIVRRRGDHVGDGIDNIAPPVAIEVDCVALQRARHELRRAEGAGPGANQALGLEVAALQDFERREKLFAKEIAAAADTGERRRGADHGIASSSARLTHHVLGFEMSMRCRTAAGTLP
jgi:hypothetical protein